MTSTQTQGNSSGAPRVLVLEHHAVETAGIIADALALAGIQTHYIRVHADELVPEALDGTSGLVVMGGPMGVEDTTEYPQLKDEMRLIELALKSDVPVLGTCLGSQLLAAVLGAPVAPGPRKEIGWHLLNLSAQANGDTLWQEMPVEFMGFHWHGDRYPLPSGAVQLAASELTECQAFRYGSSAYGFLFHMEVTEPMVRQMTQTFAQEVKEAGADGHAIIDGIEKHLPALHSIGDAVYSRWAELVLARHGR